MVKRFRRVVPKIPAQLLQTSLCLRSLGVPVRSNTHGKCGEGDAIMLIDFHRSVVAVGPLPASVFALDTPHLVENAPGDIAELACALGVIDRQSGGNDDRPKVSLSRRFL